MGKATPADAARISSLLAEHCVLFFPDQQSLTTEQHEAFGRLFGPLAGHPNLKEMNKGGLFELKAKPMSETGSSGRGKATVADEFHTDLTCEESPPRMSILRMLKCPNFGGDTMFINLCAAYDALSPPMKDLCDGLTALHDADAHNWAGDLPEKTTVHPVVRKHPVSGRKALYVNELFTRRIVELSAKESKMLLDYLIGWTMDPRFSVRYSWTEGAVAVWDNTQTLHGVVNDFDPTLDGERIAQRVTVQGDIVEAASPPRWAPAVKIPEVQSVYDNR